MTRQIAFTIVLMMVLSGCSTVGYYGQAALGQTQILLARKPVEKVITDPKTSALLRTQLQTAQDILGFAESEIGLKTHGRYGSYAHTGREAVVFNVIAAGEFSLTPMTWCYPIVGCVPYPGYFRAEKAQALAATLRAQGHDVYVGGVPAYSTLGWFDDPLLDTFIDWPEGHLANLLIHELTHGRIWVKGDAVFNESLASFVGHQGALAWLDGRPDALQRYQRDEAAEADFEVFLKHLRGALEKVYAQNKRRAEKLIERTATYDRYRACYRRHRDVFGAGRYDRVIDGRLNNAFLVARRTYDRHLPAFAALFVANDRNWAKFFGAVDQIAVMPRKTRDAALERLASTSGEQEVTHHGDHKGANEVDCETFSSHVAGGEGSR